MQSIAADKAVPGMLQRISAKNIGSSLAGKAGFKHSADGSSVYLTIPGETTSRVATHSATATLFIQDGTDNNLSIAIRRPGQFKPFKSDSSANVVEAVFPKNVLDAHPEMLPHILRDIAEFVATGEYHDTAGAMAYNYSGSDAFKEQARDRIHEDAIARGDWRTAQKMVDAAAGVGRGAKVVFRGDASLWNTARDDRGLVFFTKDKDEAGVYAKKRGDFYPSGETIEEMRKSESGFLNEHVRRFFIMPEANIVPLNEAKTLLEGKDFAKFAKRVIDSDKTLWQRIRGKEGSNTRTLEEYLGHVQTVLNNINGGIYDWEATVGWLNATAWNKFISPFLHSQGIDGVRYLDNAGKVDETTAMLRESMGKVKSADLATFDDSGELIPLSKRFDRTNSDIRFSSIGSAGAARLGIGGLDEAERMEKDGADRTEIWKKTGWWRGKDGKWRVEIPDVRIKKGMAEWLREQARIYPERKYKLGSIVSAPELFTAYPELKDLPVTLTSIQNALASYEGKKNGILIERYVRADRLESVLAHEVQHAVQEEEGFASGGAADNHNYPNLTGEVEARNTARRLSMSTEERMATPPWETEDVVESEQIVRFENGGVSAMSETVERDSEIFDDELQRQIDGTLPTGHIYQLGRPGNVLQSTGIPDLPIQLSASRLAQKSLDKGHPFDIADAKGLVKALQSPIAVFAYGNKEKAQNLIVEISSNGKNLLVGLSLNPLVGGRVLNINSIRNVFPKDTAEWLHWIEQGKLLYADKEKIQALIDQQRIDLADVAYLDLEKVGAVLDSFVNPQVAQERVPGRTQAILSHSGNKVKSSTLDPGTPAGAADGQTGGSVSQRLTDSGAEEGGVSAAMFSGARSAAAIFGGHVRVRPDGRMDYSMVKDSIVARTRMIQGSPAFQFLSQRRRLAQIAADPQRSVPRLPSFRRQFATTVEMIMTPPHCRRRGPAGTALEDRGDAVSRPRRRGRRGIHPPALEPVLPVIPAGLQRHLFLLKSFRP